MLALGFSDFDFPNHLETDASLKVHSAILSQKVDGKVIVITCAS